MFYDRLALVVWSLKSRERGGGTNGVRTCSRTYYVYGNLVRHRRAEERRQDERGCWGEIFDVYFQAYCSARKENSPNALIGKWMPRGHSRLRA